MRTKRAFKVNKKYFSSFLKSFHWTKKNNFFKRWDSEFKPFLSDKVTSTNKITLIDEEEIIVGDYNTANVLNTLFSNIAINLNIAEYSNCEPLANNISYPVSKCVVKYKNDPSLLAIGEVYKKHPRLSFSLSKINREKNSEG